MNASTELSHNKILVEVYRKISAANKIICGLEANLHIT